MNDIASVISRFARSFDLKDWKGLKNVLAELIDLDYTDLRGTRETLSREQYVALRKTALQELDTQHILSNLDIQVDGKHAACVASAIIFRKRDEERFDTHAIYRFGLVNEASSWHISSIKQTVLWNDGNPDIHVGAATDARQDDE